MPIQRAISGSAITVSYDRAAVLIGSGVIGIDVCGRRYMCDWRRAWLRLYGAQSDVIAGGAVGRRRKCKRRDQMPTMTRSYVKFVRVASKFRYFTSIPRLATLKF